jgi:dihydrofolate reductase
MKTRLYASLSANGRFTRPNTDHEIPPDVLADFLGHVRAAGNVIIGRQTFESMLAQGGGAAFAGTDVVVLSRRAGQLPGVHVAGTPEAALRHLEDRAHATALLAGGAATNNSFLERDLVDEMYVNLTPMLTGDGLTMAPSHGSVAGLRLIEVRRLGTDTVQLQHRLDR